MSTAAGLADDAADFATLSAASRALADDLKRDPATMARGLDRRYRMRPHLRLIGSTMAEVLSGEVDRLLILTPPQVGKSTLVGEWGVFWWFVNRPSDDVIIASYGADLAITRSKAVQNLVNSYGAEYGLTLKTEASQDWRLESGGHLRAAGVGTGLSGYSANLIIVDDPHADRAQAESPTVRNGVHNWWSSTASARLQPDVGVVICVQTRWHLEDFAGRRIAEEGRKEEGGRWKVVHLPAVADPRFGPDPLGREPGQPLTHPKIPTRDGAALAAWWAEKKRTSIVRDWHSLYQGNPIPTEGAMVTAELLRLLRDTTTLVEPQRIAVAVDPSGGGRDVAGIIGGFLGDDGRMWITHDRSGAMSSAEWSTVACMLAHETNASIIIIETNFGGDMCTLAIRTAWEALQRAGRIPADALPPLVKVVRAKVGKLLRAEPIAQQMLMDKVRFRGLFVDLEKEWVTWMPTDPNSPGRIDASTYLGYGLLPIPSIGTLTAVPSGRMGSTGASPLGSGSWNSGSPGPSGMGPLG